MSDMVTIDKTVVSWLIAAGGAFIMFLLALGIKDLKDLLDDIPGMGKELEAIKSTVEKNAAEMAGDIKRLEQRIEDLRHELERIRDAIGS